MQRGQSFSAVCLGRVCFFIWSSCLAETFALYNEIILLYREQRAVGALVLQGAMH